MKNIKLTELEFQRLENWVRSKNKTAIIVLFINDSASITIGKTRYKTDNLSSTNEWLSFFTKMKMFGYAENKLNKQKGILNYDFTDKAVNFVSSYNQ